jgi:hypothetical protein
MVGQRNQAHRSAFLSFTVGTGNDLSQVAGWGRTISHQDVGGQRLEKLNKLVADRLNGVAARIDVWEIKIEVEPGGFIKKAMWAASSLKSEITLADRFCSPGRRKPQKGQNDDGPPQTEFKTKMSNCGLIGFLRMANANIVLSRFLARSSRQHRLLFRSSPHFLQDRQYLDVRRGNFPFPASGHTTRYGLCESDRGCRKESDRNRQAGTGAGSATIQQS